LWFPVHVLFAVTLVAPMFPPFFVLGIVGASFPLPDTLTAVAIISGILGLVALVTYFFRQWHHLQRLGYLPTQRV
jgi:hypothetical protein